MSLLTFNELWEKLRSGDESAEIEAKRAAEVGNSIMETISAFSNEPGRGGGYLLLGVGTNTDALFPEYEALGVPDPDRIQQEIATRCSEMLNVVVRPTIWVEMHDSKPLLLVYIPEAQSHQKPVYIKGKGLPKGAFRRIASTDQHCTDEDIALFFQLRDHKSFDENHVSDTSLADFDENALIAYRRARAILNVNAAELAYNDEELLKALGATGEHEGITRATIAGLLMFGRSASLRKHFPMTRVDYIMVPSREWVRDPENRYASVEWQEPLMTLIPRVVAHVMEDVPKAFSLAEDKITRRETPHIPQDVVREAVVNALMHRSYRQKQPVQIIRYANRIEIRNPGHSLKSDERLGEPGSVLRNERIAAVLHDTPYAETKGTGIRTMRRLMAQANLTAPYFESDREADSFMAVLLPHHLLSDDDRQWLTQFADCNLTDDEARTLVVVREVGAMNNAYFRTLNDVDTLTASRRLQHLRDLKLLMQKGRGSATFYVPGERFLASLPASDGLNSLDKGLSREFDSLDKPLSTGLPSLPTGFPALPELLSFAVRSLGKRSSPSDMRVVIRSLCTWRDLRLVEIAVLLKRHPDYLLNNYLRLMVLDGELQHVYADPNHPQQAYRVPIEEIKPDA